MREKLHLWLTFTVQLQHLLSLLKDNDLENQENHHLYYLTDDHDATKLVLPRKCCRQGG